MIDDEDQVAYLRRVLQKQWFSTGHIIAKKVMAGKMTDHEAAILVQWERRALLAAADAMGFRLWTHT